MTFSVAGLTWYRASRTDSPRTTAPETQAYPAARLTRDTGNRGPATPLPPARLMRCSRNGPCPPRPVATSSNAVRRPGSTATLDSRALSRATVRTRHAGPAVGHLTAIVTGALAGALACWQLRHAQATRLAPATAGPGGAAPGALERDASALAGQNLAGTRPGVTAHAAAAQAVPAAAGLRDSGSPGGPAGPDVPARPGRCPDEEPRDPDQAAQPRPSA